MAPRQPHFYDALEKYDPEFYRAASSLKDASQGLSLDGKTRTLITMALDAISGAEGGGKSLARQARSHGATENEIRERLRLVSYVKLNQALSAAMHAFEE